MTRLATLIASVAVLLALGPAAGWAAAPSSDEIQQLKQEIELLRQQNAASEARIQALEQKLADVQQAQEKKDQELDAKIAQGAQAGGAVSTDILDSWFGDNRFVITGYGQGSFDWDRNEQTNTFGASINPIFLYRVTDRVLFEAEPEIELESTGETNVNLEYAQADIVLNDYMTFVGGKFLIPFGDFIEHLHPAWVNKLVSKPLPYVEGDEGGLMPFSDVGAQIRGAVPLSDQEGVSLDYTLFMANGPRFEDSALGTPAIGTPFLTNNVDLNKGKGFGGRIGLYPIPLSAEMGRLRIGASTYDGTWDDKRGLWFTAYGADFSYQLDELDLRGEYLQTRRQLLGQSTDRRDGWYLQAAYKLTRLGFEPLDKVELVARWSGLQQHALAADDTLGTEARPGNPREFAFGVDYWLTPSVVGKLEYDWEFGDKVQNNNMIHAQIAVGF
jgi:hypothetical protein